VRKPKNNTKGETMGGLSAINGKNATVRHKEDSGFSEVKIELHREEGP